MALELFDTGSTFTVCDADLVEGGDPETSYTLRYFTADDADRLTKAATTKRFNKGTHQQEDVFDRLKYALSVIDHVLVDWVGVVRDGEPLPCVLEYKRVVPGARREAMLRLAQENVQVTAQREAESFPAAPDLCGVR